MAFRQGDVVLLDTNVIIEAHRTGCWNPLALFFNLHTVEKVVEETQTGFQNRSPEQEIDETTLRESLAHVVTVTRAQVAAFNLKYAHPALDDGERDLLVYADSLEQEVWLLNSPDMAAVRFAHNRNWLDRLVSLEAMARRLKVTTANDLHRNYTENWLSEKKTGLRLGLI